MATFLPWVTELLTLQELENNIQIAIDNYHHFTEAFWFNVIEKRNQSFIGVVGFIIRDAAVPYFELGYWLDTEKTGQGYITEAVTLVERYAFNQPLSIIEDGTRRQRLERNTFVHHRVYLKVVGNLWSSKKLISCKIIWLYVDCPLNLFNFEMNVIN
nr:GNAT family N-acetyltransferase [Xenorhabdus poinarii]